MTVTPTATLDTSLGTDPSVERIYDNVQVQLPAIGLSAIKLALWNTLEDFFIQSTLKRQRLFWKMEPGAQTIDLDPFDETWNVVWVLHYDGLSNAQVEPPALLRDLTYPVPTVERGGKVWLALKPASFEAIRLGSGSEVWSTWFETILAGTLYRLCAQPAKPYSSPDLAKLNAALYRRGIQQARDTARRGFTDGGGNWRFPYFARGRQH